ncbi:endonuclease domain-containing protein [Candidatus Peregrinibacteria bacterium]|nr:endonuclease domain-containing protein [Candidatus Peregrinibacteria bacterium]
MKRYQTFIFKAYELDEKAGEIRLHYSLDDEVEFTETIVLPATSGQWTVDSGKLDAAVFALHLIGGISYYKTCCPKNIEIRSGTLTEDQAAFWNTVYENGLGEFFYKNDMNFEGLIAFPASEKRTVEKRVTSKRANEQRILIPIGGGKDSIVTLELLKKTGADCTLFRMGHHRLIGEIAAVAGLPLLTVERKLSGNLFRLNEEGALNGHVPITAYLSCLAVVVAELYGFDGIAMSNERSASEGNVEFHGMQINHQWSKSLAFERAFQKYLEEAIGTNIKYWSQLRPLSELAVAKMFTEFPQYFRITTSCNANWRILRDRPRERWCGHCPKCAFVFALFAAFLSKETLLGIFEKNLFERESLLPLGRRLLGIEGFKPFECVGTSEETKAAMLLAHARGDFDETPVMKMFLKDAAPSTKNPQAVIDEALRLSSEHAIPEEFLGLIPKSEF